VRGARVFDRFLKSLTRRAPPRPVFQRLGLNREREELARQAKLVVRGDVLYLQDQEETPVGNLEVAGGQYCLKLNKLPWSCYKNGEDAADGPLQHGDLFHLGEAKYRVLLEGRAWSPTVFQAAEEFGDQILQGYLAVSETRLGRHCRWRWPHWSLSGLETLKTFSGTELAQSLKSFELVVIDDPLQHPPVEDARALLRGLPSETTVEITRIDLEDSAITLGERMVLSLDGQKLSLDRSIYLSNHEGCLTLGKVFSAGPSFRRRGGAIDCSFTNGTAGLRVVSLAGAARGVRPDAVRNLFILPGEEWHFVLSDNTPHRLLAEVLKAECIHEAAERVEPGPLLLGGQAYRGVFLQSTDELHQYTLSAYGLLEGALDLKFGVISATTWTGEPGGWTNQTYGFYDWVDRPSMGRRNALQFLPLPSPFLRASVKLPSRLCDDELRVWVDQLTERGDGAAYALQQFVHGNAMERPRWFRAY
jgi:hypothetical protein